EAVGHLVVLPAQHRLPARREVDLVGLDVPVPQAVLGALDGQGEAVAGLAQLLLGDLAGGDVARDAEGAYDGARLVAHRHLGRRTPGDAAVGPGLALLGVDERPAGADDLLLVLVGLAGVLGAEDVEVGLAGVLGRVGQAETAGALAVDAEEAAGGVL